MMIKKITAPITARSFGGVAFMLTFIFQLLTTSEGAAQSQCEKELAEAQRQYDNGFFKEAIALMKQCLKKNGLQKVEQKQVYELLALIHVGTNDTVQARIPVQKLLEVDCKYDPSSVKDASALFIRLINEAKQTKKCGGNGWIKYTVAGAVAAGVIVWRVWPDGHGEEAFPSPPGRPPK